MKSKTEVTLILHTHNRHSKLKLWSKYYKENADNIYGASIIIVDSSKDSGQWLVSELKLYYYLSYLHVPGMQLEEKLWLGLSHALTDNILLCADDDYYDTKWIQEALRVLRKDKTIGVVYGEEITFQNKIDDGISFYLSNQNPPQRDLSSHDWRVRLNQLKKSDWATAGWYALQKRSELQRILEDSRVAKLAGYGFERYLIFLQALRVRTIRTNSTFLARETSAGKKEYTCYGLIENKVQWLRLLRLVRSQLLLVEGTTQLEASAIALSVCYPELKALTINSLWRIAYSTKKHLKKIFLVRGNKEKNFSAKCQNSYRRSNTLVFFSRSALQARDKSFVEAEDLRNNMTLFAEKILRFLESNAL